MLRLTAAGLLTVLATSAATAQEKEKPVFQPPRGWHAVEPPRFGQARFLFEGKSVASMNVVGLPGEAGGIVANLNRWRAQLGMPALADEEAKRSLQPIRIGDIQGQLADLTGAAEAGMPP